MRKWLNDISRDINGKLREKRLRLPGALLRYQWHQEFLDLGLDKKQSFASYLKIKTKQWHRSKRSQIGKKTQ